MKNKVRKLSFTDDKFNKNNMLLPVLFRNINEEKERMIADYISGMMDSIAIQVFQNLYKKNNLEVIYDAKSFSQYIRN
jgi:dGTPase